MFNGYFEFALADEDLTQPPPARPWAVLRQAGLPLGAVVLATAGCSFFLRKRWCRVR
jgi:hypothetical protein